MEMVFQKNRKPLIVVADDHPRIIKLIIEILGGEFEFVECARNGVEAIGAIAQFQPDVLITDIEMPVMDGICAARHLRSMEPDLKIIFMSASADREMVSAAMATDASGFVLKSCIASDLSRAIREALAGRQFVSQAVEAEIPVYLSTPLFKAAAETASE